MATNTEYRDTDHTTKGGQIFAHNWRMHWQNIKILLKLGLLGFVLGTGVACSICKTTDGHFWLFIS